MASHVYPIPEVHRSVTRPITIELIRQVLKMTGLNPNLFRTKMTGYADAVPVPGTTLDDTKDIGKVRLSTDEKLTIEIKEEDVGDLITPVRYPDNNPVFHDTDLKIMMKPVLSLSKVTVSVVINVPSKVRAFNWLAEVKRRIYQAQMTNYHTITYHYPIPKPFVYYLIEMHRMREAVEPLNESFGEWVARCFTNRWTVISNIEGHERLFAIQEKQTNIYGWFDFEFEPQKPEKESDNAGGWQIQFDYSFHYQRPDSMVFAYPLVIHNQLLPVEMISTELLEHRSTYNGYQGLTGSSYDKLVFHNNRHGMTEPEGIPDPPFDDWFPPKGPHEYIQLARTLIMVDPNDKTNVASLEDFSESFAFKDIILEYMRDVNAKMLTRYKSIFHIQFYRWDSLIGPPDITIGRDLNLNTTFDMPLTDMWHVVISVLANPLLLDEDGWQDITDRCDVFHEWFTGLFGDKYANIIKCNTDNTVNNDDLTKVIDDMKKDVGLPGGIKPGLPVTNEQYVGSYSILARQFIKGK